MMNCLISFNKRFLDLSSVVTIKCQVTGYAYEVVSSMQNQSTFIHRSEILV